MGVGLLTLNSFNRGISSVTYKFGYTMQKNIAVCKSLIIDSLLYNTVTETISVDFQL